MKKFAVVLAGYNLNDRSEITGSVSTLIALDQLGAEVTCFTLFEKDTDLAPASNEVPSALKSKVHPLVNLSENDYDAIIFSGGSASDQKPPQVESLIQQFHSSGKPIGAISSAAHLIARALRKSQVTMTLGNQPKSIAEIEKLGAIHEYCPVDDYVSDRENKVVTTPASMYDEAKPAQIFKGVLGLVKETFEMA